MNKPVQSLEENKPRPDEAFQGAVHDLTQEHNRRRRDLKILMTKSLYNFTWLAVDEAE